MTTTRKHPRTTWEAFGKAPPPRDTTVQGPYRRRRLVDPHRVVGWVCLVGFALALWFKL